MDTEKFWSMIEVAHQISQGDERKQREILIDALCELSLDEIQQFDRILWQMMRLAYRADIWQAAWVATCGCGDDSFSDFRQWLIQQGQSVYEKVLDDPESLVDFVDEKDRFSIYNGCVGDNARVAYERKAGQKIPTTGYVEKSVLVGEMPATEEEIVANNPRITAKLGDCSDPDFI